MGLEAKDLELVVETTSFIFQQAAYHLAKPAQLKAHLTNIALDDDLSLIHISEPTRRYAISYAVFCLKKKKK